MLALCIYVPGTRSSGAQAAHRRSRAGGARGGPSAWPQRCTCRHQAQPLHISMYHIPPGIKTNRLILRHMSVDSARVSWEKGRTGSVLKGVLAGLGEGLRSFRVGLERRVEATQSGLRRAERSRARNHSTESSHGKVGAKKGSMVGRTRERARPAPARDHVILVVSVVRNAAALSPGAPPRRKDTCRAISGKKPRIHGSAAHGVRRIAHTL